jgi:AcrR family transcriptional regulator
VSKGASTRKRILEAAWRVSDARGAESVLGGASLREVAGAAGLSPSAVLYHYSSMSDLAVAMVEELADSVSSLPVEVVDEMLDRAVDDGPAAAIRLAAQGNWDLLNTPEELTWERRLARCYGATGEGAGTGQVRDALARLTRSYIGDLELVYRRTVDRLGLHLVEPFDVAEAARAAAAVSEGLLYHVLCDPDAVRPDLVADVLVAFVSAIAVPQPGPVHLAEVASSLDRAVEAAVVGEGATDLVTAGGLGPLFADGIDTITFTQVARELACRPDEVVLRFGSLRRLAAMSFHRHVGEIDRAARRRAEQGTEVALADGLHELARAASSDRHCALALLHERQHAQLRRGEDPVGDIRTLVPLGAPIALELWDLVPGPPSARSDLAELLVDTVLGYAATHPRATLNTVTSTALRLLPAR